jgi:hypothetical protein
LIHLAENRIQWWGYVKKSATFSEIFDQFNFSKRTPFDGVKKIDELFRSKYIAMKYGQKGEIILTMGSREHTVTCQSFVGLRNGALLGSRPVNKSSAQPR